MTHILYVASAEPVSGKSALAVGLLAELCARGGRVGIFRPIVQDVRKDALAHLLHPLSTSAASVEEAVGVTYDEVNLRPETAITSIVERFHAFAAQHDTVLVVGSDFTGVPAPAEFATNASIAAHLGAGMVLVVPGADRDTDETATAALVSLHEARSRHADVVAVIVNRAPADRVQELQEELEGRLAEDADRTADDTPVPLVCTVPADETLAAPTVRDLQGAVQGELLLGDEELLDREVTGIVVAGMTMPHLLDRLREGNVLICPGDREEVLLASILAHR
ncbi:MAG: AAA family ATPase, partial [Micrococcus sp.]|nr:AAA family ATPase [Micrococcus sp.]